MKRIWLGAALLVLAAGCTHGSRFKVHEFWATTTRAIAPGTSFAWDPECIERGLETNDPDPDLDQWIRDQIVAKMVALGYPLHTGEGRPGMVLSAYISSKTKQVGFSRLDAVIGALVIEVYAPDGKLLLWRGWSESPIDYSLSPLDRQERFKQAIAQILQQFADQAAMQPAGS